MTDTPQFGTVFWTRQIDAIDTEIARLASICDAPVLQPGVVERIIHNDATVCGRSNPVAFKKLHDAVMMHYAVRQKSAASLGEVETQKIIVEIVAGLAKKLGGTLG